MTSPEHLASLLLTAERASNERAVAIDLVPRRDFGHGLAPLWEGGEAPIGRIVAERGRICWAMARDNDLRLSDLLAADTGVPLATFERIYESARREGVPFCEKLATSDVIDVRQVRRALLQQAAGCLANLALIESQQEVACSIAPIPQITYDNDFTFGALELLQAAISGTRQSRPLALPMTFAKLAPKLQVAICYRESDSGDHSFVPISAWARRDLPLADALDLTLHAISEIQPTDLLAAEISPFAFFSRHSSCWLAAYEPPFLSLFEVHTQEQYLALLGSLVEERRSSQQKSAPSAAS